MAEVLNPLRCLAMLAAAACAGAALAAESFDLDRLEPGEDRPGGAATSKGAIDNSNAFSHASGNLSFAREFDFRIGNGIFRKLWVSAPASTQSSDGLGPLFNARSCQRCHLKDGRGHPPAEGDRNDDAVSMLMRLSIPPGDDQERDALARYLRNVIPDVNYGGQLQDFSIQGIPAEGRIRITYRDEPVTLSDGDTVTLRAPTYEIGDLAYGPLDDEIMLSPRIANQMIGLGLLEAIPEADILAHADPDDADGDGISGRPNRVFDIAAGEVALGRFGWKAGQPSVRQQTALAFADDIGISSTLVPRAHGDCMPAQTDCRSAPDGNTARLGNVEVSDTMFDLVVFYASHLAVPPRRAPDAPDVLAGKRLFHAAGCATCHVPRFVTDPNHEHEELAGQTIWPYTDLLLHNMGDGLADNRPEAAASGREWRTAPLWGIGLTETVNGHTFFLHDGRARNVEEAILWHGGEAEAARNAYRAMTAEEREQLIAFVNSL